MPIFKAELNISDFSKECINGIITVIDSSLICKLHLKHDLYPLEASPSESKTLLNSQILNKICTVNLLARWKFYSILKEYSVNKEIEACLDFGSDNVDSKIWIF